MSWMRNIDFEELKKANQSPSSRALKREWYKKGYRWSISLYGVITHLDTKVHEGKRIEVLSNILWTNRIVTLIYNFLKRLKPPDKYTIWIYDKDREAISLIGRYN